MGNLEMVWLWMYFEGRVTDLLIVTGVDVGLEGKRSQGWGPHFWPQKYEQCGHLVA